MSTPIVSASWNTPVDLASGEVLTHGEANQLEENVGYLYGRPWIKAYATSGTLAIGGGATPSPSGTKTTILNNGTLSTSVLQNTGGAGQITLASGVFTLPSTITGEYRVHAQAMLSPSGTSTAPVRLIGQVWDTTTNYAYFVGNFAGPQAYNNCAVIDFTVPFGATGFPTTANKIQIYAQAITTPNGSVTATDVNGYGPLTAAPNGPMFNTYCYIEFTGASSTTW